MKPTMSKSYPPRSTNPAIAGTACPTTTCVFKATPCDFASMFAFIATVSKRLEASARVSSTSSIRAPLMLGSVHEQPSSPTNDVDDGGTGQVFGAPPTVPTARMQAAESDARVSRRAWAGSFLRSVFAHLDRLSLSFDWLTSLAMFAGSPTPRGRHQEPRSN
jgi:hypothetical protein